MKKTMMYLPEKLHRFLAREADERGVSMAHVTREAITQYRTRREEARPRGVAAIVGVVEDSDPGIDLATQVDETLKDYYGAGGEWEGSKGVGGTD